MNFVSKLQDELFRWKRAHAGMVRFMTKDHEQCLRTQLALRHSELIRGELEDENRDLRNALEQIAGCETGTWSAQTAREALRKTRPT